MGTDMTETRTETYVKFVLPAASARCIVLDMDDTLCHYDPEVRLGGCDQFEPRKDILDLALDSAANGIDVVIATARPCWTSYRTKRWLRRHNVDARALYLKNRQNWTVSADDLKAEMLKDIQATYEIVSFHDDSPANVLRARDLGINAIYVPGNEAYWASKGQIWPGVTVEKV